MRGKFLSMPVLGPVADRRGRTELSASLIECRDDAAPELRRFPEDELVGLLLRVWEGGFFLGQRRGGFDTSKGGMS